MSDTEEEYVEPTPVISPGASVEVIKETYDKGPVASVESVKASDPPRDAGQHISSPPPSVDVEKKGITSDIDRESN